MHISSNRPAMRSGASSVAIKKQPDIQTAQTAKNVTTKNHSTQQASNQLQAQLLNVGLNIDFTA